jgi:thiol peroxidase
VIILSAVPSLDTDVCDRETRRFNEEAAKLDDDIVIYTISADFPMAQKRWCGAASVDQVKVVSDVVDAEFGVKYGILITAIPNLNLTISTQSRQDAKILTFPRRNRQEYHLAQGQS